MRPTHSLSPTEIVDAASVRTAQRVLLVDDNADLREYLKRLLEDRYRIETANDGVQALEAIAADAPDIIVTDVMMPRMDGLELLRRIREDPKIARLPIILLSARAGEESAVEGLAAGADDYLVKPFTAEEVRARIGAHLRTAALREEALTALREIAEERKRSERRTAFLAYASEVLGDSLDPTETLKNIAEIRTGARGLVPDRYPYGGGARAHGGSAAQESGEGAFTWTTDRPRADLDGRRCRLVARTEVRQESAVRARPAQCRGAGRSQSARRDVVRRGWLRIRAVGSIRCTRQSLGSALTRPRAHGRYTEDDRVIAEELGRRGGAALYNSQRYEREHYVASALQRALLPENAPKLDGVSLDWAYRAAHEKSDVGGDWYDALILPDGTLFLSIGDVSGHGFDAAVAMGSVRNVLRTLAFECEDPAEIVRRTNQLVLAGEHEKFATAIVARFNPATFEFEYASAGHPRPILIMADGAHILSGGGVPLGAFSGEPDVANHVVQLDPGTRICLYTDGLVEFGRDIVAAEKRLIQTFDRPVRA